MCRTTRATASFWGDRHRLKSPAVTDSAPYVPTQQHAETDAREHGSSKLLAVCNRNETSLLVTDLYNAHGNRPYSAAAAPSFAPSTGITHASGSCPGTVAIHYFCNRYHRLSVC